jgi:hypothetical protein
LAALELVDDFGFDWALAEELDADALVSMTQNV